ncbi:hypothetical protein BU16DRAFT_606111 [Lophium mytilinum]|uniref:Heterokaryon incompatibility domain-containing protein n=1 Tax=Lophium mytilinum TaxID=390894 RepID=A0A6A6QZA5_9PEZI|nr:hypothetical protein BU16DRAFT_606111 [Lophium mytilinum]
MKSIYENAERVVLWLGFHDDDGGFPMAKLLEIINLFKEYYNQEQSWEDAISATAQSCLPGILASDRALKALVALFRRHWWSRLWVVQEATTTKDTIHVRRYMDDLRCYVSWGRYSRACLQTFRGAHQLQKRAEQRFQILCHQNPSDQPCYLQDGAHRSTPEFPLL